MEWGVSGPEWKIPGVFRAWHLGGCAPPLWVVCAPVPRPGGVSREVLGIGEVWLDRLWNFLRTFPTPESDMVVARPGLGTLESARVQAGSCWDAAEWAGPCWRPTGWSSR
jgi:hypothetical protein